MFSCEKYLEACVGSAWKFQVCITCALMLPAPTDLTMYRQASGTLQLNTKLHERLSRRSQVARRKISVPEGTSNTRFHRPPHTTLCNYVTTRTLLVLSAVRSSVCLLVTFYELSH